MEAQGTCMARHDDSVNPCYDVTENANQRCSDADFHWHFQVGVAHDAWEAPESVEGQTWQDGKSRKGDEDYRQSLRARVKWQKGMIGGWAVAANQIAGEVVRIRKTCKNIRWIAG